MKLHCPHCGVKGSTEDSYLGRKVKCPKCQDIFEVLPDMAAESPAEASLPAAPSPLPADVQSAVPEVDIPAAVDVDLAETETEAEVGTLLAEEEVELPDKRSEEFTAPETITTSAAEQEEILDWEDIASEADLQLAEATKEEEEDRLQQDGSAAISSFEQEFEKPVDDFVLMEELPPHDDAESPASPTEVSDRNQEKIPVAENSEKDMVDDGVELEPDGIDKEQCRQCGKEEGVGESFTARDGRLYCLDCVSIENRKDAVDPDQEQVPSETLNAERPGDGGKQLSNDSAGGYDDEKPMGNSIYRAWAKARDTLARWFGK